MKLISKKIQVKNIKLKTNWSINSINTINDLKMFGLTSAIYFFYKAENDKEIQIIKNNFKIHAEYNNDIFYEISLKQLRKAKILILEGDLILKKIIEKSETKTAEDVLTSKLSYELAQGIDKEIIKNLMTLK